MNRRMRISCIPLLAGALTVASCSSDDGGGGGGDSGDGGSIVELLGEIPASASSDPTTIQIVAGDLDLATEASGKTRPDNDDTDDLLDWIIPLTGIERDGGAPKVHVLLPESVAPQQLNANDEIREELGWSVTDVHSFIELQAPPDQFAVLRADVTAEDLDAAIGDAEDGIWSLGGADFEVSLEDVTPARELGESLRMALDDDLLVVSRSTPPVQDWLADDGDSLADDDTLATVAEALDDAGVYSAMLVVTDFSVTAALGGRGTPEQIEEILGNDDLIAPFDALGVGLSVEDDEPFATFVYHYGSADDAKAAVENITAVFEDGRSFVSQRPLSEMFEVRDVVADGDVAVATVGFRDALPGTLWQMVYSRDLPTTHG